MPDYVAHATTTGGRNGHVETSDGLLKADLSIPKVILVIHFPQPISTVKHC
jgi:organic hydroperoxide reductase OsmC/OhrA